LNQPSLPDALHCPAELQEISRALSAEIRSEIQLQGAMSFARFMELSLYHPTMGYYQSETRKFGVEGDFITAPELSPLFSQCVANQLAQVLRGIPESSILELGAGSGVMAVDMLRHLQQLQSLPMHYYILELSAQLRSRQQERVAREIPWFFDRVTWLDSLEEFQLNGVVLANELLDAMPVQRFRKTDHSFVEICVKAEGENFVWSEKEAGADLLQAVQALEQRLGFNFPEDYNSEIHSLIAPWMRAIANVLQQGLLLLIDYGYPEQEYYLPERSMGTLMCHFRHRAHDNPLVLVGVQDITSYVNFSTVAQSAVESAFDLAGFTSQAHFLLACGIDRLMPDYANSKEYYESVRQLKLLTLPGEMGERFKVMALTKGIDEPLLGFSFADFSSRL